MKRQSYIKYAALFLALVVLVLLFLGVFLPIYLGTHIESENEDRLENSARSIRQSITAMMDLSRQDFQYLLDNEGRLLYDMLVSQRVDGEMELFITDSQGNVLISAPLLSKESVSYQALSLATDKARDDLSFESDLDGLYSEKRLVRVVLLEKEYSDSHRQRVGAVFLSLPKSAGGSFLKGAMTGLLVGLATLLVLTLVFGFLVYWEILRPLQLLDEAAEAFARGDFSRRLPEYGGAITPLLRAYNQMAEKVEKNESLHQTFISNVSHDLRTPLTTIGGFVQNMMQGTIPPEKSGRYYKIILDEVDRLSRLVQTLLESSRMTAGERKFNFAPMDLCELGRITLLSFEKRLEEKEIQVSFFASPETLFVRADRDAIQQVVYNLLDNAIKFTPQKGSLAIEITQEEKKAFFAVTNSGEGIPEDELAHLFDRFYKSDRSRGLDKKGMGLGLFIAKTIIGAHGEEIWVESKVGSYTQFVFSLPLI